MQLVQVKRSFVIALICFSALMDGCSKSDSTSSRSSEKPAGAGSARHTPVSFAEDVASIVFKHCSTCHRPGETAPFNLLTYEDVKKHARQIAEVTEKRIMPPWLPEHGYGEFADERRLTDQEIGTIHEWVKTGTPPGEMSLMPAAPKFDSNWKLAAPDVVVALPSYTLAAEGRDIYHSFVARIPTTEKRYVRGVELLPGNNRVVHHAFIQTDETGQSRRLAAKQNPPGFDGMEVPESSQMPGGHLLGWQPGKMPYLAPDGLAWILKTNTDLVLQVHMNPSGKPEQVQPSVGFYFTDVAPTNSPFRIKLTALELDIPAGATNYAIEQAYTLPVDVTLVRVGSHAHYLGKEMQSWAQLPNGEKKWLLWIKNWDFKWQGDYQYKEPVYLPKGTTIAMRFSYDNSTNNVRNPHVPPEVVRYGPQSADEMGELYFQAVAMRPQDYPTLARHYADYFLDVSMRYYAFRIRKDPKDAAAYNRLGRAYAALGKGPEALENLTRSIELDPKSDKPHFDLGLFYLRGKDLARAEQEFLKVVQLNPEDSQAFGSLGIIYLQTGRIGEAQGNLERAVRLNPDDRLARQYLEMIRKRGGK